MSDIENLISRLRARYQNYALSCMASKLEEARAENERLRAALARIINDERTPPWEIARAALKVAPGEDGE